MKKIVTILAAASLMLVGTSALAQASIGAGFVNSSLKSSYGSSSETTSLNGFYVGGSYNISLGGSLGIAPGLYYTLVTKSDSADAFGIASAKSDFTEQYLSVPVMFNYGLQVTDGIVGRFYAGPTLAYGLSSKSKYEGEVAGITGGTTVDNYDDSDYGRFDVMIGGGVAVEFYDMIRFDLGYDYGLLNRSTSDSSDDGSIHRSQFHVGVAYMF